MFDPQHFVDLQEISGYGDPKSWLSGEEKSSPTHVRTQSPPANSSTNTATNGNVDRVLFNDLVQIVPLVQSLIDRNTSSSFTRRCSMIYTKTPSRGSFLRKITDPKGRNATQSIPIKKRRDEGKYAGNNQEDESFSIFSSKSLASEKDKDELVALREQVEDLQRKLLEKDELLKSAETSSNQIYAVNAKLDELKHQALEKDTLIKSTRLQLSDAKIKLADKQAALEKIQWESMTSNSKVEKLQEELDSVHGEISSFIQLFEGLTQNDSTTQSEDYDIKPYYSDGLSCIDDFDDVEILKMEEEREAYITAVAAAKEKQDEESIAAAVKARLHLQAFVFRPQRKEAKEYFSEIGIPGPTFEPYPH
ncbi:hypothetical protein CFOL_v3_25253 [Cephalotus follicularis]|uniref:Movement protein binding protein 2C n=1 Tax=Cephalotus follicularis TaxID=3775 RepID=A0A1Q3CNH3_CEPFO|nr:hypothetical protein CFOL_v3_25253 [Cephalotus follicularis]